MKFPPHIAALGALALTACETFSTPVPKGYAGLTATLRDSISLPPGKSCGSFFFLYEYEGKDTDNALNASTEANRGNGLLMRETRDYSRQVPAVSAEFHIAGRTHCAAPIQELTGTVYFIHGKVRFTPEANQVYVITGELGPEHSAVWIVNERTGAQIGNKLLVNGESKAGFFDQTGHVVEVPPPQ